MCPLVLLLITYLTIDDTKCERIDCDGTNPCGPCTSSNNCELICDTHQECMDYTLECESNEQCFVGCYGSGSACKDATINAAQATDLYIDCIGYQVCSNTIVNAGYGQVTVVCDEAGGTNCDGLQLHAENAQDVNISCPEYLSCANMDIWCGVGHCILNCSGQIDGCQGLWIDARSSSSFTCIGEPCENGDITSRYPTKSPTIYTSAPTTNRPTTMSPTTSIPTTQMPTTSVPTTVSPTTMSPTTATPTTMNPTTATPTTAYPTTTQPTKPPGSPTATPTLNPTFIPTNTPTNTPITITPTLKTTKTPTDSPITTTKQDEQSNDNSGGFNYGLSVAICLVLLFIVLCLCCKCKKKKQLSQDKINQNLSTEMAVSLESTENNKKAPNGSVDHDAPQTSKYSKKSIEENVYETQVQPEPPVDLGQIFGRGATNKDESDSDDESLMKKQHKYQDSYDPNAIVIEKDELKGNENDSDDDSLMKKNIQYQDEYDPNDVGVEKDESKGNENEHITAGGDVIDLNESDDE
eukprot:410747_1